MWRKGNPLTLLVGMQTSTATMENSVEIPLKTGNRTAIRPSNPTAGHTHWGTHVSFNSGFLGVYVQQWDCWVIWHFYFQFLKESPHCSPQWLY